MSSTRDAHQHAPPGSHRPLVQTFAVTQPTGGLIQWQPMLECEMQEQMNCSVSSTFTPRSPFHTATPLPPTLDAGHHDNAQPMPHQTAGRWVSGQWMFCPPGNVVPAATATITASGAVLVHIQITSWSAKHSPPMSISNV